MNEYKELQNIKEELNEIVDNMLSNNYKLNESENEHNDIVLQRAINIINRNKNLLPDKEKNIFLNLEKVKNIKLSDDTIERVKKYLIEKDYKSITELVGKDISLLGGNRRRNKSKRNKSRRNKSRRNKSKRNKSKRNKSRRKTRSKYNKLRGGDDNDCSICLSDLNDTTEHKPPITLHTINGVEHRYHLDCIANFYANPDKRFCPLCRQQIPFDQLPDVLQEEINMIIDIDKSKRQAEDTAFLFDAIPYMLLMVLISFLMEKYEQDSNL